MQKNNSNMTPTDPKSLPTIYQAFHTSATLHADKVALMHKNDQNEFQAITYRELDDTVGRVAAALSELGIKKGDRVAIFSHNRPEWAMADLAILKLGGIVVPIYQTLPASAAVHILKDSGSKLLFVENRELFAIVETIRDEVPHLVHIVAFDADGIGRQQDVMAFDGLRGFAGGSLDTRSVENSSQIGPDDTATIVYTSGTTGEPKGAVLSHANIVSNALSAASRFRFSAADITLSYLPLCHMFERTCGYYTFLFSGARIAYAKDMTTIVEDVQTIQPTILIAVPRIIEKVYRAVENKVLQDSFIRRKLVLAALGALNLHANLKYKKRPIPLFLRIRRLFYDAAVASKFRKIAGNNLRLLVSGGAPLDRGIAKALYILGFNIVQGYGLTETAPVVCCCSVEDNRLGTVGKPLDGVEVKIGANDEILVRGPNVMTGYFHKPEQTAQAIDAQGWFHTGDQGRFDESGNLIITGRIKDLIITSYGKNVAPAPIESALLRSRYIEQAVLCGDNRKCIAALIVPRRDSIERWARERDIPATDYEALLRKEDVRSLIACEIDDVTGDVAPPAKVKAFTLLAETFSVDNHLLTPTLKLRRGRIFDRYADEIEAMYQPDTPQHREGSHAG